MNSGEAGLLRRWRQRQDFQPGRLGWLINPFYFARRGLVAGLGEFFPELKGELLDVGCGRKPYRAMIPATRYVGLEIDTPRSRETAVADAYYAGRIFPFTDESFDAVFCSQVFEHVFSPAEFLREINRVLRPGGCLLLTVPFVWDEHEQPHDFARYSSFGLRAVLERAGFTVEQQRKSTADARILFQLLNAYIFKITQTRSRLVFWLAMLGLMAPVNLFGILFGFLLPANADLYLDNIVLVRKRFR